MATSTLLLPHDVWRRSSHGLITPPMSTALVSLPPITYFDRRPNLVPPQDASVVKDRLPTAATCEMVCYLWFSAPSSSSQLSPHQIPSPPYSPEIPPTTSPLQLAPSAAFVQFMHKLLETTQVSQSVIVLSLHYIWRLKERNRFTNGLPGSEFRIAVAALMMANKFLDDNTYTNKTWSEVSGIDLCEIHKMEREFLTAVDFSLHVSGKQYASWLNLLKGLVLAKESESRKWRGIRARYSRLSRQSQPMTSVPVARTYRWRCHSTSHRARSTSPMQLTHPTTSTHHELPPLKRPTGMTLQIPETSYPNCPSSGSSPLDSLYSLAKMSLSSSPHAQRSAQSQPRLNVTESRPQTLIAAYRADRPVNVPQSLYYYSLAGSSINGDAEQPKGNRKARLRCYQPPPQPAPPSYTAQPPPYVPMDVQSASPSLPHLHDAIWARKLSSTCGAARPAHTYTKVSPGDGSCVIPSAPFANAGPPGVHFYTAASTSVPPHHASHHRGSPAYPSPHTWTYGK
ncbi:cyclin-domain-containing protein [Pisolithus marmoratus]|nr:cyclin-domain-containing protein [Pisolithus marmoratus]